MTNWVKIYGKFPSCGAYSDATWSSLVDNVTF